MGSNVYFNPKTLVYFPYFDHIPGYTGYKELHQKTKEV